MGIGIITQVLLDGFTRPGSDGIRLVAGLLGIPLRRLFTEPVHHVDVIAVLHFNADHIPVHQFSDLLLVGAVIHGFLGVLSGNMT